MDCPADNLYYVPGLPRLHRARLLSTSGGFKSEQAFSNDHYDFTVTLQIADTVSAISFFTPSGVPFREDPPDPYVPLQSTDSS